MGRLVNFFFNLKGKCFFNPAPKNYQNLPMQAHDEELPINILQHFIFDNTQYEVDIKWIEDEPLFKAADIGRILGIKDIHTSIAKFDADEKNKISMPTPGGIQEVLMLTEVGVYRLLFQSRKPIAKPFKKWVAFVIREVQRKGLYNMQRLQDELQQSKEEIRLAKHNALLKAYHNKYVVYFGFIRETNGKMLIKIGATKDIRSTFTERHPNDYGQIELIHAIECQTNEQFEKYLLHHKKIRTHLYKEPVKLSGGKSNEVVLVDDQELKEIIRISKANTYRFRNAAFDVQTDIKDVVRTEIRTEINDMETRIMNAIQAQFALLHNSAASKNQNDEADEEKNEEDEQPDEEIEDEQENEEIEEIVEKSPKPKKKRMREKGTGKCAGCNVDITNRAKFCAVCVKGNQEKKFEVSKDELYDLVHVKKVPFTKLGLKFGVSDNAVRKRCRALGIEVRRR